VQAFRLGVDVPGIRRSRAGPGDSRCGRCGRAGESDVQEGQRSAGRTPVLALLALLLTAAPAAQVHGPDAGAIRGRVVDAADGAPLPDVLVRLDGGAREVRTPADGRFAFEAVAPGTHDVYVSRVGYALARRIVEVAAGEALDIVVPLSGGTGAYTEEVIVDAHGEALPDAAVPSRALLSSGDLQDVRGVLADDPFRAVQALPGVVTGDDFRSEFSVRGGTFRSLGVLVDGFPAPLLVHTVRGVQDTGSVAIINTDLLEGVSLSLGGYPQRSGNRTGAELGIALREGSRTRQQVRAAVSGTSASVIAEGPLTGGATGSWVAGIRKSYLDWIVERIDPDANGTIGFVDGEVKLVVDTPRASRLEWLLLGGRAHIEDRSDERPSVSSFRDAFHRAVMTGLTWRGPLGPSLLITQRASVTSARYHNENGYGASLVRGTEWTAGARSELLWTPSAQVLVEVGASLDQQSADLARRAYTLSDAGLVQRRLRTYGEHAIAIGGFALVRVGGPVFTVSPGLRVDHHNRVDGAAASPWLQAEWMPRPGVALRAGGGLYQQPPDLEHFALASPIQTLGRERAVQAEGSAGIALDRRTSMLVTGWMRRERGLVRAGGDEWVMRDGRLVAPVDEPRYWNGLDGTARGLEVLVRRDRRERLSGWIGYAWSRSPYRDTVTGETFAGDFEQRHTFNLLARYAHSPRTALSAKLRVGSNLPLAGYYEWRDGDYYISEQRNRERLATYARLDLRANRTFNYRRTRLTLFLEVLNATGHDNRGPAGARVDPRTGRAWGLSEDLMPLVPSAGVLVEF
jgi:hypothetical protein